MAVDFRHGDAGERGRGDADGKPTGCVPWVGEDNVVRAIGPLG